MSRMVGTVSMGIRAPIIRSGDDLAEIVTMTWPRSSPGLSWRRSKTARFLYVTVTWSL